MQLQCYKIGNYRAHYSRGKWNELGQDPSNGTHNRAMRCDVQETEVSRNGRGSSKSHGNKPGVDLWGPFAYINSINVSHNERSGAPARPRSPIHPQVAPGHRWNRHHRHVSIATPSSSWPGFLLSAHAGFILYVNRMHIQEEALDVPKLCLMAELCLH